MKTYEEKIENYIKEELALNKNRYKNAVRKYKELKQGLKQVGFKSLKLQGSFAIKTAIKPKGADEEYDVDTLLLIDEEYNSDDFSSMIDARITLIDYIKEIGRTNMWGEFDTLEIKKGIKIKFANDFHIDLIPVFRLRKQGNENTYQYIFNYSDKKIERTETLKLTKLLKDNIDTNKRTLLMLLKKTVANNTLVGLEILPSIGSAVMHICDIKVNEVFSVETILNNMNNVISLKKHELYNPFLKEEEFFEKSGNKGKYIEYLTAIDSFRLTLEHSFKENNLSILVDAINGQSEFIISTGITSEGGSGGHA